MCLLRWQSKEQRQRNSVCLSRLMFLPTSLGQTSSAETNIMNQRHLFHKHPHSNKVVTENRDSPSVTRLLGPDTLYMAIMHNGLHPCPWSRQAIHTHTRACPRMHFATGEIRAGTCKWELGAKVTAHSAGWLYDSMPGSWLTNLPIQPKTIHCEMQAPTVVWAPRRN